jgi:membrane protein implicated in regulation of membrane protease activity
MGGFRDPELLVPISFFAIAVALCLPVVQLSPALFIALIAAAVLLVLVPWLYSERRGRRRLNELRDRNDRPEGDR